MYVFMYVRMNVCMNAYALNECMQFVCMNVWMYIVIYHVYACMYLCIQAWMHA
jgi:hypothetical protein